MPGPEPFEFVFEFRLSPIILIPEIGFRLPPPPWGVKMDVDDYKGVRWYGYP